MNSKSELYPEWRPSKFPRIPFWIRLRLLFRPRHTDLSCGLVYKEYHGKFYCVDEVPELCEYLCDEVKDSFRRKQKWTAYK